MIRGVETDQRPRLEPPAAPAPPPGWAARLTGRARTSPYYPALSHPVLRRVLPGAAASALGDGMSAVAIAWLALELAPEPSRGLLVGAAVAAYSLPGAAGAVALRLAAATGPAVVIAADAASWAVLAISYARIVPLTLSSHSPPGALDAPPSLVAPSSLLSPGDAATFGSRGRRRSAAPGPPAAAPAAPPGAWAVIRSSPVLPGLLALSFVFYLLYGPVEVALPVRVATDLHGSAALLGMFWAVFGVGAIIGELAAPYLRRWRVWPIMTAIVLGRGLALIPLGLVTPLWTALAAFFAGAVIWGPWMSLSMEVLQDARPPAALAQVIAARGSLLILAARRRVPAAGTAGPPRQRAPHRPGAPRPGPRDAGTGRSAPGSLLPSRPSRPESDR
jgi:DHA3 family macrolide efflux protein-like MFS transporter